ncbi:MAG: RagB/SusD family nutrient uptake outer membrane protein [Prevotellaceae bacterium]|jgi:hypothetical protein|nr:RagB/SusD family nutrient uptake outer membrane protein [Prevotellaceae bacterium]
MKKLLFLTLTGLAVALYSCNKENDEPETPGNIITTEVVKTDKEAEALGNAVYGPLQTLSSSFSFLLESHTESTVSFEGAETAGGPEASRLETTPANSYVEKLYNRLYQSIGASNIAIERLDSSKVTDKLSQETKDLIKARVKFTRALSYLYLVQLYGEVPLKLKQADANKNTRVAIDEIYTQIVQDLVEAEAGLPLYDRIRSNPSKGAANALLARAYLTWGQKPLSQAEVEAIKNGAADPAHSVDNEKLQKAVEYADKVIDSDQYELLEDFNRNFGVAAENTSAEHIYTIHHDGDNNGDAQGNHQTHCPFTERFDLWVDNHIGPSDVTLVDRYSNDDRRKLFSIVTRLFNTDENNKEYQYKFPVTSPRYGKFIHRSNYNETPAASPGRERAGGSAAAQPNNINRIEIRYAEVLLIKAEALFFLNRGGEALPLVNRLRQRAFGEHYSHYQLTGLTKENLFEEWDLEFSFEQKHWQNLVRWKTLVATVKTVDQFEYYKEDYKDNAAVLAKAATLGYNSPSEVNAAFFAKIYKHLHAKHANIKGKHYRFPVPTASGINQGVSPQNPGY